MREAAWAPPMMNTPCPKGFDPLKSSPPPFPCMPGAQILCQGWNALCLGFTLQGMPPGNFPQRSCHLPKVLQAPSTHRTRDLGCFPCVGAPPFSLAFDHRCRLFSLHPWDMSLTFSLSLGIFFYKGQEEGLSSNSFCFLPLPLQKVPEPGDTKGTL